MNDDSTYLSWYFSHKTSWEAFKPWTISKARAGGCGNRSTPLLEPFDASKPPAEQDFLAYMSIYASFEEIMLDGIIRLMKLNFLTRLLHASIRWLGRDTIESLPLNSWSSSNSVYSWNLKRTYSITSSSSSLSILWRFLAFMRFLWACDRFGLEVVRFPYTGVE